MISSHFLTSDSSLNLNLNLNLNTIVKDGETNSLIKNVYKVLG
jgi:hypothetical protein